MSEEFLYRIHIHEGYIELELKGKLSPGYMEEATEALLAASEDNNILRVLYSSELEPSSSEVRKKSLEYFKKVSCRMEKLASFIPDKKIFWLAKLMGFLTGAENYRLFSKKDEAIAWLKT